MFHADLRSWVTEIRSANLGAVCHAPLGSGFQEIIPAESEVCCSSHFASNVVQLLRPAPGRCRAGIRSAAVTGNRGGGAARHARFAKPSAGVGCRSMAARARMASAAKVSAQAASPERGGAVQGAGNSIAEGGKGAGFRAGKAETPLCQDLRHPARPDGGANGVAVSPSRCTSGASALSGRPRAGFAPGHPRPAPLLATAGAGSACGQEFAHLGTDAFTWKSSLTRRKTCSAGGEGFNVQPLPSGSP